MSSQGDKRYGPDITLTQRPDIFTLDDDPTAHRAEMPCGHVVGPSSLTDYCRSLLNDGKFDFRCPYKENVSASSCNALWDFHTVKKYACLTGTEITEFEGKMKSNYLARKGHPQCPVCLQFITNYSITDIKLECSFCHDQYSKRIVFCRFCVKIWQSADDQRCGNRDCIGEDSRVVYLRNCHRKTIAHASSTPAVRACPTCYLLIEHAEACNQVVCRCGQEFCFICLTKREKQTNCNKCQPAPVQSM